MRKTYVEDRENKTKKNTWIKSEIPYTKHRDKHKTNKNIFTPYN